MSTNNKPIAFLPVFTGTNCDYDTAKAFTKEQSDYEKDSFSRGRRIPAARK